MEYFDSRNGPTRWELSDMPIIVLEGTFLGIDWCASSDKGNMLSFEHTEFSEEFVLESFLFSLVKRQTRTKSGMACKLMLKR